MFWFGELISINPTATVTVVSFLLKPLPARSAGIENLAFLS
jgi:hypothetical protein